MCPTSELRSTAGRWVGVSLFGSSGVSTSLDATRQLEERFRLFAVNICLSLSDCSLAFPRPWNAERALKTASVSSSTTFGTRLQPEPQALTSLTTLLMSLRRSFNLTRDMSRCMYVLGEHVIFSLTRSSLTLFSTPSLDLGIRPR